MRLLRFLLGRTGWGLYSAILAGAASGAAATGLLVLVNSALAADSAPPPAFAWGFLGLCLLAPAANVLSSYLLQRLGQGAVMELRLSLSREVLATPLARLEELGAHRLLTMLTEDIGSISGAISMLPVLAVNGTIVTGALLYLLWLSPPLFLGFLGLLVVGVASYWVPLLAGIGRFRRVREIQEALFRHLRGLTEGIKELKLHGERRRAFLASLASTADRQRRLQIGGNMIFVAATGWGHLLFFLVIGALLVFRPHLSGLTGQGVLVSYVVVVLYLMAPLQTFLNLLPQFGRAGVSVQRIEELGLTLGPRAGEPAPAPGTALDGWRELRLAGVTHRYRGETAEENFQLGPVDLTLRRGELVIVAGGNGSGKTTLAKLLVGLYEPDSGEILLDGRSLAGEGREAYRGLFSVVFSDFYLFEALLGLPAEGLDERARHYLGRLQLTDKVRVEDGHLSTLALSHGQRKRLALLTAYLEDRPVYLFDEWAADQDPVFKRVFYQALLPELKSRGKTVVVVSHDEAYYEVADRLLKLDGGRIANDRMLAARPAVAALA
jgi:putative ATP-binding cassette transporter